MIPLEGPKDMRAAILVEQGRPLVVDSVSLPSSLSCGQVLVQVDFSGICGSQIGEIDGVKGPDPYLPHLLGHEGSGRVLQTGPGVKKVRAGDGVILHWMKGGGIDSDPPVYRWRGEALNAGWVTTFNEFAIVSENRLTPFPDGSDSRIAALLGCAASTGLGLLTRKAALTMGESIVVIGAGGVGLCAIHGASLLSARPIVAVDIGEEKLRLAERVGATEKVLAGGKDTREQILSTLGASGSDVVVETTGLPESIRLACDITAPRGRTILVGVPRRGAETALHTLPLHFGRVLTGTHGGETEPDEDLPRYLKMLDAGILDLDAIVTDECALDGINEAIGRMRRGEVAGKAVIRFKRS